MRRDTILKRGMIIVIVAITAGATHAEIFDWRNVDGKDFITPVRDQGQAGTCWAFAAVAALEAKFDIYTNNPNLNLDLSEQHLVCDGSMGTINGGYEFLAADYLRTNGIVREATLPYTAQNTSPYWPLTPPYTLYGVTANQNFISMSSLKSSLKTYGPLIAFMDAYNDFNYWPTAPTSTAVPDYYADQGWHAVALVGFVDDPDLAAGGYWIIKNSWGPGWGDDGYGYSLYGSIEQYNRVHALTGDPFTVYVPLPGAVLLGILGFGVARLKLRKSA
jgi:C1A family cysteine protease